MHDIVTSRVYPFIGFIVRYLRFCFDITEATSGSAAKSVCVCACVCVRRAMGIFHFTSLLFLLLSLLQEQYVRTLYNDHLRLIEHSTIIFGCRVSEGGMAVHYRQGLWKLVYWIGYWLSMHMHPKILIFHVTYLQRFLNFEKIAHVDLSFSRVNLTN